MYNDTTKLRLSIRAPGGEVVAEDVPGATASSDGSVGIDSAGTVTVVWSEFASGPDRSRIVARTRSAGGAWSALQELEPFDATALPFAVDVAVNGAGAAVAVWTSIEAGKRVVYSASRAAGASQFGTRQPISSAGIGTQTPSVVINENGDAAAAWTAFQVAMGAADIIRGTVKPAGGDWKAEADAAATGDYIYSHTLAIDEAGRVAVAYPRPDTESVWLAVRTVDTPRSGTCPRNSETVVRAPRA